MRWYSLALLVLTAALARVGVAAPAADPFVHSAQETSSYVLIEFTSETCPACEEMRPIVDKVLAEHPSILYREIDADLKPALAKRYNVKCVPVYVVVDPEGNIRFNQVGMRTEQEMAEILRKTGAAPQ